MRAHLFIVADALYLAYLYTVIQSSLWAMVKFP